MGTSVRTIDHLLDTLAALPLTARKMFGEYAIYMDGKVVALVCDDQLFLKPTARAHATFPDCATAPPYPGAKPHLLATDALDDPDQVIAALKAIAADLPTPRAKAPKP